MRLPAFITRLALCATASFAQTASAEEQGIFVWNDPQQMAIRMVIFTPDDPNTATAAVTLQPLKSISSTMTGVESGGQGIGLCLQQVDDNVSPASLFGFDLKGKTRWEKDAGDFLPAIEAALPKGHGTGKTADWFTFSCEDAGAGDKDGVLAFDVGLSAGPLGADGYIVEGKDQAVTARLHLSSKTGKVLAAALVENRTSRLKLAPNPTEQLYSDAKNQVLLFVSDPHLTLPKSGRGQVLWGNAPILWKGKPVVDGFDFAWYLPVKTPK